jgi:hypothetical protein
LVVTRREYGVHGFEWRVSGRGEIPESWAEQLAETRGLSVAGTGTTAAMHWLYGAASGPGRFFNYIIIVI